MGRLTTHVLDTAHGIPARGVALVLYRLQDGQRVQLLSATTNADGRCEQPLLEGAALLAGVYELEFAVGPYFAALGVPQSSPPFLDLITLRFGVADASQHFHVPLVLTPWSYSTYRGS
jgi:5-hydroxyisourate hydrolase